MDGAWEGVRAGKGRTMGKWANQVKQHCKEREG